MDDSGAINSIAASISTAPSNWLLLVIMIQGLLLPAWYAERGLGTGRSLSNSLPFPFKFLSLSYTNVLYSLAKIGGSSKGSCINEIDRRIQAILYLRFYIQNC
jgi:hypothetical protein